MPIPKTTTLLPRKNANPMNTTIDHYYEQWWRIEQIFASWSSQNNTNPKALFTISQLYRYPGGCNQGELCEKLAFPKQTLSSILQKLEENGLVSRELHPGDRRNKLVKLTQKGFDETAGMMEKLSANEQAFFQTLTKDERDTLLLLLNKVATGLEKIMI